MVDLSNKQLRVFSSVAQSGNLGRTAELLHLTRGAVSQSIKALEAQLGATLFERQQQRLYLNARGRMLLPLARQMLSRQESILALFDPKGGQAPLRLGASLTLGNYLLPSLLAGPLASVRLAGQLQLANSSEIQESLLRYELDLGLIESEQLHPGLERRHWRDDEMLLIVPPDYSLAGQSVHWPTLSSARWIVRESHSGSREQFDQHLAPHLDTTPELLQMGSLEAVVRSVASGLGCALVSELACRDALRARRVSQVLLPEPLTRRLYLVWGEGNAGLPQVASALKALLCR